MAVAVLILSVAFVGAIGYIFWQNHVKESVVKTDLNNIQNIDSDNNVDEIALTETVTDGTFDANLSVRYPSDWTKTTTSNIVDQYNGNETTTLISPDGQAKVHFKIINSQGFGVPVSNSWPTIESIDADVIENYPDSRFASVIYGYNGTHEYYMGIQTNNERNLNTKVGDDWYASGYALFKPDSLGEAKLIKLYLEFENVTNGAETTKTAFEEIKNTDNYKTAKAIIQSLYVK